MYIYIYMFLYLYLFLSLSLSLCIYIYIFLRLYRYLYLYLYLHIYILYIYINIYINIYIYIYIYNYICIYTYICIYIYTLTSGMNLMPSYRQDPRIPRTRNTRDTSRSNKDYQASGIFCIVPRNSLYRSSVRKCTEFGIRCIQHIGKYRVFIFRAQPKCTKVCGARTTNNELCFMYFMY